MTTAARPQQPTEQQVTALGSGDRAAWEAVVRWLQPALDRYFASRSAEDPEGLTQETFIRMHRAIDRFTSGGALELQAWAFAIARTIAIDASRRRAVRPVSAAGTDDEVTQSLPDVAAQDEHAHLAAHHQVESLLGQLTDQQAEFLRLRIYADATTEQAALSLGMNLGQAKQLQRRALRRLASILTPP